MSENTKSRGECTHNTNQRRTASALQNRMVSATDAEEVEARPRARERELAAGTADIWGVYASGRRARQQETSPDVPGAGASPGPRRPPTAPGLGRRMVEVP